MGFRSLLAATLLTAGCVESGLTLPGTTNKDAGDEPSTVRDAGAGSIADAGGSADGGRPADAGSPADAASAPDAGNAAWTQVAHLKAHNAGDEDRFGTAIAISGDGATVAVGVPNEDGSSTGVDGADNNNLFNAGAVYVYRNSAQGWAQVAYLKSNNPDAEDLFGWSVALSDDGNTLAVAATGEDSSAPGVGGSGDDNRFERSGAVYVFTRGSSGWAQTAFIKASNVGSRDRFGHSLALSADGSELAVGAPDEASENAGIGAAQDNDGAEAAGAVYLFRFDAGGWSQVSYVKPAYVQPQTRFGFAVALDDDGDTLAVGARDDPSGSHLEVDASPEDRSEPRSGAAYVFTRTSSTWTQHRYIKAPLPEGLDAFGGAVDLDATGALLVVGAQNKERFTDNMLVETGAIFSYRRDGATWRRLDTIWGAPDAHYGTSVALDADGTTLATGQGPDGHEPNRAHVFDATQTGWSHSAELISRDWTSVDAFGRPVAISSDGQWLAVGATNEDFTGAVYVFRRR